MTNQVTVTKRLTNEGWVISGRVEPSSEMPKDIFVYENTGTTDLGKYFSVVSALDMHRIPVWSGSAVASRVRYVRSDEIKINVPFDVNVDDAIEALVSAVKAFYREFTAEKESTKTYVID